MKGVFSCSPVWPTIEEIETCECIGLTSAEEWKPKPDVLEKHKKAHQDEQPKKSGDRILALAKQWDIC